MTNDTARRVLHLATRDEAGVKTLIDMIADGLAPFGVASTRIAMVEPGASKRDTLIRLSEIMSTLRKPWDAVFAYQPAAALTMASVSPAPIRASHLTALPEGIKPRWRALDIRRGVKGGYTHIISNSRATHEAFGDYPQPYRDAMQLIPHGVEPLPEPADGVNWRARLELSESDALLTATGRLAAQKDFPTAIRALIQLPNVHLAIAGEGGDEAELRALAARHGLEERVHFLGRLPRADLAGLIRQGDAYLFPSVWETFGLAGAEALMEGSPVIASDLAVLREVLDLDGIEPGFVRFHRQGDPAKLAAQVRRMLEAPFGAVARAEAARLAREAHDPAKMIARYRALLGV